MAKKWPGKVVKKKNPRGFLEWFLIILGILVGLLVISSIVYFFIKYNPIEIKSACEINNLTCYQDSCPSGYAQVDYGCKNGKVCCNKIPEKSDCEKYNNVCYNNSCPSGTIKLEMGCKNTGEICCSNSSTYQTPCQKQGNVCLRSSMPEPACPSGYALVDLGCVFGEICCKKILSQCEASKYACKDSCSSIEQEKLLSCGNSQKCCDFIIKERSECEKEGYRCQLSSCNSGYTKMGICGKDYFCCKKDSTPKIVIHGFVKLKQGNCMPPVDPSVCTEDLLDTYVGIFPLVPQSNLEGPYYKSTIEPITSERSIKNGVVGYYEIEVPDGKYSVFAQDPLNFNTYYCNDLDSSGYACLISVNNESVSFDITIDHATY